MALANQMPTVGTAPCACPGPAPTPTASVQRERQEKRLSLALFILGMLSLVGMLVSIWMIFFYTPVDALQGEPQRILYVHVPTAWGGMLGFIILAVAGIIYLFRPDERLDWIARASAEISAVYLSITLLLGMLWGKPIWGVWW